MAKEAFDTIMAGFSDAIAYAQGDKSRGKEHIVEVSTINVVDSLMFLAAYCDHQAMKDENLVVQEYHDQWMAARTEILRCAGTIRKGW